MKKIIFICLIMTLNIFSQENSAVKYINQFYAINQWDEEKSIRTVEFKNYKGFKIDNVFFLTERSTYYKTIKEKRANHMWYVFTACEKNHILRSTIPIWCCVIQDKEIDNIVFIFNLGLYSNLTINQYFIEFEKKYLK